MSEVQFSYSDPAELYGGTRWVGRRSGITYRRFDTAAEAIQFAVEELGGVGSRSCILEVNENRFNHQQIRKLYDRRDYPLPRHPGKDIDAT